MSYRQIFKKSWSIAWKNKFLWFFGLFLAIFINNNEFNVLLNNFYKIKNDVLFLKLQNIYQIKGLENILYNFKDFFSIRIFSSAVILLGFLIILVFLIWIFNISKGALIYCFKKINENQKTNFREGFGAGKKYFWSVLSIGFISRLIIYGCLILILLPFSILFFTKINIPLFWLNIFIFSFLLIFILLYLIISFVAKYAYCYLVLENNKVAAAIKKSIDLFALNWSASIEMSLILFLIDLSVNLILTFFIFVLALPFIFIGFISYSSSFDFIFLLICAISFIILTVVYLVIKSVLMIFQYDSWVLFFLEINQKQRKSKFIRFIHFLFRRLKIKNWGKRE